MSRSISLFAWGIGLLGAAVLFVYGRAVSASQVLDVAGFALCAAVFERYRLSLPNRVSFSLGSVFVMVGYAKLGMPAAALIQAAEAIVGAWRTKRLVQKPFNFGQLMLSLVVLHATTGRLGTAPSLSSIAGVAALLIGSAGYFSANTFLVGVVVSLASRRPLFSTLAGMVEDSWQGLLTSVLLVSPMLYTFQSGGWIALFFACLALLAFRYAINLYLQQKQSHLDSLSKLSTLLERKSGAAENHAQRVARLAQLIAESLRLPADEIDTIYAAGMLHDIGESEVDPRVVSVMARRAIPTLADEEAYRTHAVKGAELVERMQGMAEVARLIRYHHEAWDGSGYPMGLKGDAIPVGAAILAAAEVLETAADDVDAQLRLLPELKGTLISPDLIPHVQAALCRCEQRPSEAQAIVASAGVTRLQNQLSQALRSSKFLENSGSGWILSYEQGTLTNYLGQTVSLPVGEQVAALAEQCLKSLQPVRNLLTEGEMAYDVYCVPSSESVCNVLVFDVTALLEAEREQRRRIFRAYRDVMEAATQGRLILIEEGEGEPLLQEGVLLGEVELKEPADGKRSRALIDSIVEQFALDTALSMRIRVSVSEAVTNVFKHAGKGHMAARLVGGSLRVIIRDEGDGIPFEILPHAVLADGYSTKRSLGKGFSILLRFLDRLYLQTSRGGTCLILEKQLGLATSSKQEMRTDAC